jgi:hypothetical protein
MSIQMRTQTQTQTQTQYQLVLANPAKKSGGDKYTIEGTTKSVYVPQEISRLQGDTVPSLLMTVSTSDEYGYEFKLLQKARSTGDDRYTPAPSNTVWTGDIYIAQGLRADTLYITIT